MIEFNDKKYGKVIILEYIDLSTSWLSFSSNLFEDITLNSFIFSVRDLVRASIVAYRNLENKQVKILKNRYPSDLESEVENFILKWDNNKEEKVVDPILTRWEILDIR